MRTPPYVSPTALDTFYTNREEYYNKYLSENRPPRTPQNQPMAIGSAFDAFVKTHLSQHVEGCEPFDLRELFETQVEEPMREWAWSNGKFVFEFYRRSGALASLMDMLVKASMAPKFELTVQGKIDGVPILGKPDLYFVSEYGAHVILDWKVNGFCSTRNTSPMKGYALMRDGFEYKIHKDYQPVKFLGIDVNGTYTLDQLNDKWAAQQAIYAWLLGEKIGGDFVICIEQITGCSTALRVATHRCLVSKEFQLELHDKLMRMWELITTGHIFDDLSIEESRAKCESLEIKADGYKGDTPEDAWFRKAVGR